MPSLYRWQAPAEDIKYDTIVKAIIRIFKPCKRKFYNLVRALMVQEMVDTQNWNDLFRSKSAVTAVRIKNLSSQAVNLTQY